MSNSPFPCGEQRFKKLKHDPLLLIPLKAYCQTNFCSRSTALYRIHSGQIIAYKLQGEWYVVP